MFGLYNADTGDMAELVECARLEIAYTGNCIEGSNPPISARNLPALYGGSIYGGHIGRGRTICNQRLPGSEQAHIVRAVKGAHEQCEWELQSPYLRQEFTRLYGGSIYGGHIGCGRTICNQRLRHLL